MAVYEKWSTIKYGTLTVGKDDVGHDVKFYGATSGKYWLWDESADTAILAGDLEITGNVTLTGDVTHTGGETYTGAVDVTLTDPTTADDAFYGYIDAGGAWTSGNMVAVRGKVTISGTNNFVSATGVWAGLDFATSTGSGSGLTCAINAEVTSNNSTAPNAIIYIQSLPNGSGADFSNVPYIAFTEYVASGTGSNYLFSLGHQPAGAGRNVTSGDGKLFDTTTIKIEVNGSDRFIPLSTVKNAITTSAVITTSNTTASSSATTGALIVAGGLGVGSSINSTITDPTAPKNAVYGVADVGVAYSSGSVNAVKGRLTSDCPTGNVYNQAAGWFGLNWDAAQNAMQLGATRAINAEVVNNCGTHPSTILYLQSVPGTNANHSGMPYIVFTESGAGTGSNILFELGHEPANQTVTSGAGNLLYNETIRIVANDADRFIPLSTVEGTYTSAYPVSLTYSSGNALLVTTATATTAYTDITLVSTYTGTTQWEYHQGAQFTVTYTPSTGTGSCWVQALGGTVNVNGIINAQTYYKGIGANLNFAASANYQAEGSIACALTASITSESGAVVSAGNIAVLHVSCSSQYVDLTDVGATDICTFIFIDNDSQHAVGGMDSVFRINSWDTPYLFDFKPGGFCDGIMDSTATKGDQCVGHIKLRWNNATCYLNLYSDNS